VQTIFGPTAGRADTILGVPSRIMSRAGMLIGILLRALCHHPVQALGAIVSGQ
jgi:hypothetical protein